jgi:hypothetical protein
VATTVETVRVQASRGRSLPHPVRPRPSRHRAVPADRGWMRHALAKERSWGPISGRTALSPGPSSAPLSDPLGPDPTCTRESPVEDLWWRLVGERLCLPSASATSPRNSGCCRGLDQRLLRKVQAERQAAGSASSWLQPPITLSSAPFKGATSEQHPHDEFAFGRRVPLVRGLLNRRDRPPEAVTGIVVPADRLSNRRTAGPCMYSSP